MSAAASEPGDEGSFRDRQRESRERWLAMHEESERQHPIWRRSRAEGGSTERSATCPRRRAGTGVAVLSGHRLVAAQEQTAARST